MEIGEKIKKIREEKKLSQRDLAKVLGLSQPNIAYFENRGNSITIENVYKLAGALGVSAQSLLFDDIDYTDVPNSKEVDNLLIAKDKEIEDLRKENEKLKLRVDYETLLRTSKEDKINALCWGYVKSMLIDYKFNFYEYLGNERLMEVMNEIINNDDFMKFFVETNKELLCKGISSSMFVQRIGYSFFLIDQKDEKNKFGKQIMKEYEKMIRNPVNNENFVYDLLHYSTGNGNPDYWNLMLFLEEKFVVDDNLLQIEKYILYVESGEEIEKEYERVVPVKIMEKDYLSNLLKKYIT